MVSLNQTRSGYLINAYIAYPHLCTNMLRDVLNFRLKIVLEIFQDCHSYIKISQTIHKLRLITKSSNTEAGCLPSESADSNIDIFGLVFYCISYFICGLETQSFISFEMYYIAILTSKIFYGYVCEFRLTMSCTIFSPCQAFFDLFVESLFFIMYLFNPVV